MTGVRRLGLLTTLVAGCLFMGVVEPAGAVFPGENGRIVFQATRSDAEGRGTDIYSVNPDGTGETRLTDNPRPPFDTGDYNPSFAPGGGRIAFDSDKGGTQEIWTMLADGSGRARLTTSPAGVWDQGKYQPSYSPDGRIAFATHKDGRNPDGWPNIEVYSMSELGGEQTNLTNHPARDEEPAYAPDGKKIAFVSDRAGTSDIFVMNPDGSGPENLTADTDATVSEPSWSPDGSQIVYNSNGVVHLMNADGTSKTALDTGADPVFSPDCTKVAFVRETFVPDPNDESGEGGTTEVGIHLADLGSGHQARIARATGRMENLDWQATAVPGAVDCADLPSDTAAPTITLTAPEPNAAGWHRENVAVTIEAADEEGGSGVKDLSYSAAGAQTVEGTTVAGPSATFDVTAEGTTTVSYRATDNTGNAEEKTFTVNLDKTSPRVSCGSADGLWHKEDFAVSCSAADDLSGLADAADFKLSTSVPAGTETANAETASREVYDAAGNVAAAGPVGGNKVDKEVPAIVGVSPANAARNVAPAANVAAAFTETMDRATLNRATVELLRRGTAPPVAATVAASPDGKRVTLNPARALARGATYTAIVTTGTKDPAGNPLDTGKAWRFTVRR